MFLSLNTYVGKSVTPGYPTESSLSESYYILKADTFIMGIINELEPILSCLLMHLYPNPWKITSQ